MQLCLICTIQFNAIQFNSTRLGCSGKELVLRSIRLAGRPLARPVTVTQSGGQLLCKGPPGWSLYALATN